MKQTVFLPLLITIFNLMIAWAIAVTPAKQENGSGFILILLIPIVILLSPLIYVAVHRSTLALSTKRTVNIIVSFVVTIPIILFIVTDDGTSKVQSFNCGQNRVIQLSTNSFCEITCPLLYQVIVKGKEVVPHRFIYGYDAFSFEYQLVTCNNRQLFAVTTKTSPFVPLLIHDFTTGKSWPYEEHDEPYLRTQLNKECPQVSIVAKLQNNEYLTHSESLEFGYSSITDSDLARVLPQMQQAHSVSLAYTQITDESIKYLSTLSNLSSLDLTKTAITDKGIQDIVRIPHLTELHLEYTNITNEGLELLQTLNTLEWLYLDDTKITDQGVHYLLTMPNLIYVSLVNTEITDLGLAVFQGVPETYRVIIDVNQTHVTCDYLKELQQILPNIDFRLSCGC